MLKHNTTRNQKARLMFQGLGFFPKFSESLIAMVSLLKGYDYLSHLKEQDQNLWIQHLSLEKSDNSFSISSGVKLSSFHYMANYRQENQEINFCAKNTIQPPSLITLFSRLLSANHEVNLGRLSLVEACRWTTAHIRKRQMFTVPSKTLPYRPYLRNDRNTFEYI